MEDARLIATREKALNSAQAILVEKGVLSLTHGAVSKATGISRSTLYRHWPTVEALRDASFKAVATPPNIAAKTNGPLKADLYWLLSILIGALNETPWGKVAPQVIASAATEEEARLVIMEFMKNRFSNVEAIFEAAKGRGELPSSFDARPLIEMAIAGPYFRKLILSEKLDSKWLKGHVDRICSLAVSQNNR